jgi:hypothetical protein
VAATVGDPIAPYIDVQPYDETTAATLRILRPDGTEANPAIGGGVPTQVVDTDPDSPTYGQTITVLRFSADEVSLSLPRSWVLVWQTTGTGAGTEAQQIWVEDLPAAGGVAWAPTLERVASYVPRRTLVEARDGYGVMRRTFDGSTHPTGDEVSMLIRDAIGWVSDRTGLLDITLHESAMGLAAKRAAAFVELGYPDNDADVKVAEILLRTLETDLKALAARNQAVTGEDPDDPNAADVEGTFGSVSMFGGCSSYRGWL